MHLMLHMCTSLSGNRPFLAARCRHVPAAHSQQICLGPVCIPLHLLLPFLIGLAHQYGYLKWFKREWVTLRFWTNKFRG